MAMKQTDLAYIAGYFDGEGCISVWKRKAAYTCISPRHILTIQISSTDKSGLDWINRQFKGTVLYAHNASHNPRQADAWKWIISAKRAAEILRLLLPYLKLKKKEAKLAIALQDDMQHHLHESRTHGKRGIAPLSEERQEFRDSLMNQIKLLKTNYKRYGGKQKVA
jgi:LAGLIDADG endonuclease